MNFNGNVVTLVHFHVMRQSCTHPASRVCECVCVRTTYSVFDAHTHFTLGKHVCVRHFFPISIFEKKKIVLHLPHKLVYFCECDAMGHTHLAPIPSRVRHMHTKNAGTLGPTNEMEKYSISADFKLIIT